MNILRLFFFGIIASLSALFLELGVASSIGDADEVLYAFFVQMTPMLFAAVIIEEAFKFIFIYKSCSDLRSNFGDLADSSVIAKKIFFSSIYIGMGFVFVELLVGSFSFFIGKDFSQLLFPALGIIMVHIITSAAMGYLLGRSISVSSELVIKIFLIAASLHIFYNLLVVYSAGFLYTALYLLSLILFFLVMFIKITSINTK